MDVCHPDDEHTESHTIVSIFFIKLTVRVSCDRWEGGLSFEKGESKASEKQKTRRSSLGLYEAEVADELENATMRLLISRSPRVGAQIARSPALDVMRLRTRLNAVSATTIQTSQRETCDHPGKTSPARAKITAAMPARSTAWIIAEIRNAGGNCPRDAPPIA